MRSLSEGRVELFVSSGAGLRRRSVARMTVLFGRGFPRRPGCETRFFVLKIAYFQGVSAFAKRGSFRITTIQLEVNSRW